MKFSLNLIKKFVPITMSSEMLAELLTLKSVEVEGIEKTKDDRILDVKVLYNRGDLLSHYGMAREISALTGKKLQATSYKLKEAKGTKSGELLRVEIQNPELCPRYTARVVQNITVQPSPEWLKTALESVGLRSINNIVDATNYVMLELGQPLHAFDYEKIAGHTIVVRSANPDEMIDLLDEARGQQKLASEMLVIADTKRALAIAGVKGGRDSGITETTKTIVIESANFNGSSIRRTSTTVGLRTDASVRFQYGLDPNLTEVAIDRAAQLIAELSGGMVASGRVDVYPKPLKPWKVVLKNTYLAGLLGEAIPDTTAKKILTGLGMNVAVAKDQFVATVPTYRRDITTQEDLVEEIGRVYGYEHITPSAPTVSAFPEAAHPGSDVWQIGEYCKARRLMKQILKGMAFTETYNYSFVSEETKDTFAITDGPELLNPVSSEYRFMRPSLIPNLVVAAQGNMRFVDALRLFEIGNVFGVTDDGINEREQIAGVVIAKDAFSEIKGAAESFLQQLGIDDPEFVGEVGDSYAGKQWYHPGKVATIRIGSIVVGILGELHPTIRQKMSIDHGMVAMFSFNMPKVFTAMQGELEFEQIPKYPSVVRDISILVQKDVTISQILDVLENTPNTNIVKDVDVFDVYEDPRNPKKSVAFHVVYRADDHTLTTAEVNTAEESMVKLLKGTLQAEIR